MHLQLLQPFSRLFLFSLKSVNTPCQLLKGTQMLMLGRTRPKGDDENQEHRCRDLLHCGCFFRVASSQKYTMPNAEHLLVPRGFRHFGTRYLASPTPSTGVFGAGELGDPLTSWSVLETDPAS